MSSLKRAKWIEGITQSKRILRDMAEILTTAIRDEEAVADGTKTGALCIHDHSLMRN